MDFKAQGTVERTATAEAAATKKNVHPFFDKIGIKILAAKTVRRNGAAEIDIAIEGSLNEADFIGRNRLNVSVGQKIMAALLTEATANTGGKLKGSLEIEVFNQSFPFL